MDSSTRRGSEIGAEEAFEASSSMMKDWMEDGNELLLVDNNTRRRFRSLVSRVK
jgi:hypothetical protein